MGAELTVTMSGDVGRPVGASIWDVLEGDGGGGGEAGAVGELPVEALPSADVGTIPLGTPTRLAELFERALELPWVEGGHEVQAVCDQVRRDCPRLQHASPRFVAEVWARVMAWGKS